MPPEEREAVHARAEIERLTDEAMEKLGPASYAIARQHELLGERLREVLGVDYDLTGDWVETAFEVDVVDGEIKLGIGSVTGSTPSGPIRACLSGGRGPTASTTTSSTRRWATTARPRNRGPSRAAVRSVTQTKSRNVQERKSRS